MLTLPDYRVRQRDFLLQISRAITAQLDLDEVLRRALHASVIMTGAQVGLVALNDVSGSFRTLASHGVADSQREVVETHMRALAEELSAKPGQDVLDGKLKTLASELDPSLRQVLALPLVFAGRPLGLLVIFRSYSVDITPNDLSILQSFADQAAIAVNNAQIYAEMRHERMRLQALLDHSADGVMILDRDLTILQFNEALVHLTGYSQAEAVGAPHDKIVTWESLSHGDLYDAIADGYPFNSPVDAARNTLYVEGDLRLKNGQTTSVGITYAPMLDSDGALSNVIANVRDISNFRQAQEMQNTFISVISHELKTPVAIIKGYAATLRREDAEWDKATVQETLGIIEEEADRLTALIQDLLTASRLQAQSVMTLDLSDVWIPELARRVVDGFRNQTSKHHFVLRFANQYPVITGDETRLRQVLENLVGNAIKYSMTGGTIEIGGEFDESHVTFHVTDQGVGIAQTDQEHIFERFYRAEGALRRTTPGTGLGLYLAKAVVDAHHGIIDVESKLGEGATFHVRLSRDL